MKTVIVLLNVQKNILDQGSRYLKGDALKQKDF